MSLLRCLQLHLVRHWRCPNLLSSSLILTGLRIPLSTAVAIQRFFRYQLLTYMTRKLLGRLLFPAVGSPNQLGKVSESN